MNATTFILPPSLREMMDHMSVGSTNGVAGHLVALERKGCVVNANPGRAHSWRALKRVLDVTCPHCGGEIEVTEELS